MSHTHTHTHTNRQPCMQNWSTFQMDRNIYICTNMHTTFVLYTLHLAFLNIFQHAFSSSSCFWLTLLSSNSAIERWTGHCYVDTSELRSPAEAPPPPSGQWEAADAASSRLRSSERHRAWSQTQTPGWHCGPHMMTSWSTLDDISERLVNKWKC